MCRDIFGWSSSEIRSLRFFNVFNFGSGFGANDSLLAYSSGELTQARATLTSMPMENNAAPSSMAADIWGLSSGPGLIRVVSRLRLSTSVFSPS